MNNDRTARPQVLAELLQWEIMNHVVWPYDRERRARETPEQRLASLKGRRERNGERRASRGNAGRRERDRDRKARVGAEETAHA